MMAGQKHTAETLAREFWSRRADGALSVKLSVKQVNWLRSLLHQLDKRMPYSHTYTIPTSGVPLALVIYPNGAGFLKVEEFAIEYVDGKPRVKAQYAE